jgi:hypothetical protein
MAERRERLSPHDAAQRGAEGQDADADADHRDRVADDVLKNVGDEAQEGAVQDAEREETRHRKASMPR